jgi:crotonobetainyl-CoA:carnitine CoA-transferase CaiB-like acyl-CoA transferase
MRPLDGIRVLDLTRVLSGPFCTMTLSDLGAEIIKVEPPQGDDTRHWGPPVVNGQSTYFLSANRNKRSVVLNLKDPAGQQALWDLIATADIVVENFRPGTLARLGFGWEVLHERFPRLILVSISGYGQTGPLATRPGYDLIAQGEGGLMSVTGEPGRPPVKVGFSIADIGTGMWAVIGTLSALRAREQTGMGDWVDVSLLETVVSWQTYLAEAYLVAGDVARPLGSAHPTVAPYQTFEAADGYFNLGVGNDSLWARVCDVLDGVVEGERWYRSPEYARNLDRVGRRDQLAEALNTIFRQRPRSEWLRLFTEAGVPAGSVNSIAESFEHPQIRARDVIREVEHPALGPMPVVRIPILFGELETTTPTAPPLLGADTATVLRSLGYSDAQVEAVLHASGEASSGAE